MKTTIEAQRAETFLSIYGVRTFGEVLKMFESDYNKCKNRNLKSATALYRDYSYAIFFMYSPSSIRNNLVKFKNIIKAGGGKYQSNVLEAFNIEAIYSPIKSKDLSRKKELKAEMDSKTFKDDEAIAEQTKAKIIELNKIIQEKTYTVRGNQKEFQVRAYYILAILSLSGGRRFTENLKTLKLTRKIMPFFEGLLKGNNPKIQAYIIGITYKEFQAYLRELRRNYDTKELTEQEVSSKYAKVFNNGLKRLGFQNVKALRRQYSVAGSVLFKEPKETKEQTITRILGHREVFSSALNYI